MCLKDSCVKDLGFAITMTLGLVSLVGIFIVGYTFSIVDIKFDETNWNYLAILLMVFIVFIFITNIFGIFAFCYLNKIMSCIVYIH